MPKPEKNSDTISASGKDPVPHLFCFGLGYSAMHLARELFEQGWRVSGTSRPGDTGRGDGNAGPFTIYPFDRNNPLDDFDHVFETVTHVLVSIPPDAAGDAVLDIHGNDIRRHGSHIEWIGYLSTVGVYGDTKGRPVDENAPLLPTQERSRFRALAENRWQNMGAMGDIRVHVFRLAGIYGPGRSVLDKLRRGTATIITRPGHRFSRIHVDDITQVLVASINNPAAGSIYNVADDEPAEPADVTREGARLLGVAAGPEIPFAEAQREMSDMARTFWADRRLVSNRRMKEELGVRLKYPTYREGLKAVIAAGG